MRLQQVDRKFPAHDGRHAADSLLPHHFVQPGSFLEFHHEVFLNGFLILQGVVEGVAIMGFRGRQSHPADNLVLGFAEFCVLHHRLEHHRPASPCRPGSPENSSAFSPSAARAHRRPACVVEPIRCKHDLFATVHGSTHVLQLFQPWFAGFPAFLGEPHETLKHNREAIQPLCGGPRWQHMQGSGSSGLIRCRRPAIDPSPALS